MATLGHVTLANMVINSLVQMTELHDLRLTINRQDLSSTLLINVNKNSWKINYLPLHNCYRIENKL